jgi:hypothetical protein
VAQNTYGMMCEGGLGVKQDIKLAADWFRKGAEQGDAKAQSNLGRLYTSHTASGLGYDPVKAYLWLKLSADKAEVTARNMLGEFQHGMTAEQIAEGSRQVEEYRKARAN